MRRGQRRGTPSDLLVVGLGNPGEEYARTRHNIGADCVELLADRHGGRLKAGRNNALEDTVGVGSHTVGLAFPLTYMNNSGLAVRALVRRHSIDDLGRLVIVHDELDLPVGRLKIKQGGGNAGHNGLASIQQHLGSADFVRVRIGVGRPPGERQGAGHVLKAPSRAERAELDEVVARAADAVESLLTDGLEPTMATFNAAS